MDRAISGRARNVSRGGLCATLTEELAVGTAIEIDLKLVFGGGRQSEPLRLPGRIAWCTAIDDRYQLGAQFLPIHDETLADLRMFLRYLDGGWARAAAAAADAAAAPATELPVDSPMGRPRAHPRARSPGRP